MIPINVYYIIGPLSGALIGYVTNWVAIKMLFRPYTEKRVLGFRIPFTPGLIPKRRYILAQKTGQTISEYLLTDETLIEHLCSKDIKNHIERFLEGFLSEARNSRITLGRLVFGDHPEDASDAALSFLAETLSVSHGDMAAYSQKLDERLLSSGKKIGELLPSALSENLRLLISRNTEDISARLLEIVKSPFFEENIKPLALKIISQNIKGLASLFVVPESVYTNFHNGIVEYLQNPDNRELTEQRLLSLLDAAMEMNVSEIASAASGGDGRLLSGLIEKAGGDSALSEILKSVGVQAADMLLRSLMSLELREALSVADDKLFNSVKAAVTSRYDTVVRKSLPSVLKVLGVSGIIEEKINEFEMKEAEDIIIGVVDRELKAITYFGGILGFAIGIATALFQSIGL